ncbi:MAG: NAD+ synthase [Candidatus Omnitrophota bacterium]|jgi:NAD+ synthase (glutamine-hydrolysing)
MKKTLRVALAQINCTVGDLEGNCRKIGEYIGSAEGHGADIIAFPELAVTGYPPEDLLLKPKFIADNLENLEKLARSIKKVAAIVGFVDRQGKFLYNAAAVIYDGKIRGIYRKMLLPNYGVFDEKRYFTPGENPAVFKFGEFIFGVNICEDIWHQNGPIRQQALSGAGLILNINASPYYAGRIKEREAIVRRQARDNRLFIVYTNLVGGQDELVFDGQSMVVDKQGKVVARLEALKEDLLAVDLEIPAKRLKPKKRIIAIADKQPFKNKIPLPRRKVKPLAPAAEVYQALTLGLADYVGKNGFKKVVLGLSGGIDSSLVAALAVDALGKENVVGVFLPSRYSSAESASDAKQLAGNLGIKFSTISIEEIYRVYLGVLEPHFSGREENITEENLQSRIRGNLLMALSNKFGWLVLATGNKSEMSTGYATLYGDMAGGFAVLKDVPKILVYALTRYRNSIGRVIPERVLTKEPTAELKPNQKDTDTLPAYETLDAILKAYIEEDKDLAKIISLGFAGETAREVIRMVDRSEYKRRQSPPGIKITYKAFGKDRRMPITNRYRV